MVRSVTDADTSEWYTCWELIGAATMIFVPARHTYHILLGTNLALGLAGVLSSFCSAWFGPSAPFTGYATLVRQFDLDAEANVPTWYQSALLLCCALLLLLIVGALRERPLRSRWLLLALIFLGMSMEEVCGFHNHLSTLLDIPMQGTGFMHFGWVVPGTLVVAVIGAIYVPFVLALPPRIAVLVVVAGCTYVAGALGMEVLEGPIADRIGEDGLPFLLMADLEEFLEMTGAATFVYALLRYIQSAVGDVRLRVNGQARTRHPETAPEHAGGAHALSSLPATAAIAGGWTGTVR